MANSVNRYFEGLLVGGTLGFVAGLLTAPKPGSELRRELADSADDMLRQANGNFAEIKDRMNERVQPFAEKAGTYKEQFTDQASVLKNRMSERTSDIRQKVSGLTHKAQDKFVEMKDKYVGGGDGSHGSAENADGSKLLDNYMGNNSGPVYTAGNQVSPDLSTMPASDSCSNYSAGKAGEGAAGG